MAARNLERYTIGQLQRLNDGNTNIPSALRKVFASYSMPEICLTDRYENQHNALFSQAAEAIGGFKSSNSAIGMFEEVVHGGPYISDDERVLQDIATAFSSITSDEATGHVKCASVISGLMIAPTMLDQIVELLFNNMDRNDHLIPQYIEAIFAIRRQDHLHEHLQQRLVKRMFGEFDNPVTLPASAIASSDILTIDRRKTVCRALLTTYSHTFPAEQVNPKKIFNDPIRVRERYLSKMADYVLALDPKFKDNTEALEYEMARHTLNALVEALTNLKESPVHNADKTLLGPDGFAPKLRDLFAFKTLKRSHRICLRPLMTTTTQ